MVTSATRPPPSNHLLASLPSADFDRLASTLDIIPLKLKTVVHTAGETVQHVYFPGGGFLSILTVLEDGSRVEVATIGREGVAGLPAAWTVATRRRQKRSSKPKWIRAIACRERTFGARWISAEPSTS